MGAVTNVQVKNSELLAEPLTSLQNLVPSLLTLAEPQLSQGLTSFTIPSFNGFTLKMVGARGIGRVTGSTTFNHVGLYADLLSGGQTCKSAGKRVSSELVRSAVKSGAGAALETKVGRRYSWRVDGGFWSTWQQPDALGHLVVQHPRLLLGGEHVVEVRTEDGENQQVVVR